MGVVAEVVVDEVDKVEEYQRRRWLYRTVIVIDILIGEEGFMNLFIIF